MSLDATVSDQLSYNYARSPYVVRHIGVQNENEIAGCMLDSVDVCST